jgi:hypothetical protein
MEIPQCKKIWKFLSYFFFIYAQLLINFDCVKKEMSISYDFKKKQDDASFYSGWLVLSTYSSLPSLCIETGISK